MKHKIALSGSYSGGSTEKLLKGLSKEDILQLSLIGREITLQVRSENLEEVMKALQRNGVDNISILEWKKAGITVASSGTGSDAKEMINVSLIPNVLGEGISQLAFVHEFSLKKTLVEKLHYKVEEVLKKAGVTDVVFIVQAKKKGSEADCLKAAEAATLKALFESGGLVNLEQ